MTDRLLNIRHLSFEPAFGSLRHPWDMGLWLEQAIYKEA